MKAELRDKKRAEAQAKPKPEPVTTTRHYGMHVRLWFPMQSQIDHSRPNPFEVHDG